MKTNCFFLKFTLLNAYINIYNIEQIQNIQLTLSNEVSTKLMYLWIGALNCTLLSLSSRKSNENLTKLSLLYVARKVWHRNIWFLTETKRYSFLSLWNDYKDNINNNNNILFVVNEESPRTVIQWHYLPSNIPE